MAKHAGTRRKPVTAKKSSKSGPAPLGAVRLRIFGKALVQHKRLKDALEIRVYTSQKAAIDAGLPQQLAENVFRTAGACAGGCGTEHDTVGAVTYAYCTDIKCEEQGDCACHLIRHYEDPATKTWKTEDLGKHYGKRSKVKEDGTSKYVCDCYSDSNVTV